MFGLGLRIRFGLGLGLGLGGLGLGLDTRDCAQAVGAKTVGRPLLAIGPPLDIFHALVK